MKVRIGLGSAVSEPAKLVPMLDAMHVEGFDSIWLPEILTTPSLDPVVALAYAAARYPTLKLGTTMLLPGRHPVRLAKQLATLDALCGGRLLVTFVTGLAREPERSAVGPPPNERLDLVEELLPVVRNLLAGGPVDHDGPAGTFTGARIAPLPVQDPLEFWLGGLTPRSLAICGRLGDGWLPALLTPAAAAAGKASIEAAAAATGRQISPEHYGVSIGFAAGELPARIVEALRTRAKTDDLADVVPVGHRALRALIERYVEAGFSKFVVRPMDPVTDWASTLGPLAESVLDLQT